MPGGVLQTPEDLKRHLQEQLEFLESSALAYDSGFTAESKRMAVSLRILFHDTSRSKSLLGQLGLKGTSLLDSSLPYDKRNVISFSGLIEMSVSHDREASFHPLFDRMPQFQRKSTFDDWWNAVVFADNKGIEITRCDLVLSIANQDGGVHVDPTLNDEYARLSRQEFLGWKETRPGKDLGEIRGAEHAAIRQISHEILTVFREGYKPPADHPVLGTAHFAGASIEVVESDTKEVYMAVIEMISDEELKAHHCLEKVDRVSGDPETTAFKRRARLHQALWREAHNLGEGTWPIRPEPGERSRPMGSCLALDSTGDSNFLTDAAVQAVRWRLDHPEPHQMLKEDRLYRNLLSSMPMCFNLFGPLYNDADLEPVTNAIRSWLPDAPGYVNAVRFEWSPGRRQPGKFLENGSAFDVAFDLTQDDGTLGVLGVETKYHEHCRPEKKLPSEKRLSRYKLVTDKSEVFKPGAADTLVGTLLEQIWLDHLLALSMLQHEPRTWTWAKFLLVHPEGNPSYARAADEYRTFLNDSSTFEVRTIESLLDANVLPADATAAFRERYLW